MDGEAGARQELARMLRLAADMVERHGYLDVMAYEVPEEGWKTMENMGATGVVMSHPCPG